MQNDKENIELLLKACEKGDSMAQMKIYNKYSHAMFNTAYRIISDTHEAENIMQDAFLAAFTKLDVYNGKFSFGIWLKRIVINKSISHLRSKKRYFELFDETYEIVEEKINSEDIASLNTEVGKIIENIKILKDNYRIALNLNLIEGYDYEEISEILGISNQNSRTIVSRAKIKLRGMLKINK
jgi:RNA polymerase sigma-70 factor (ECF subfamily)